MKMFNPSNIMLDYFEIWVYDPNTCPRYLPGRRGPSGSPLMKGEHHFKRKWLSEVNLTAFALRIEEIRRARIQTDLRASRERMNRRAAHLDALVQGPSL